MLALLDGGYTPIYDIHGDLLWKEAQQRGDPAYRGVAVRFGECIYRRLLGAMLHEALHASFGDTSRANYGVPFGLPYGVPEEAATLAAVRPEKIGRNDPCPCASGRKVKACCGERVARLRDEAVFAYSR